MCVLLLCFGCKFGFRESAGEEGEEFEDEHRFLFLDHGQLCLIDIETVKSWKHAIFFIQTTAMHYKISVRAMQD